jgi:hypothetical protein
MYVPWILNVIRVVGKCGISHKNIQYTEVILYKNRSITPNALYIYYKQQAIRFWVIFKHEIFIGRK